MEVFVCAPFLSKIRLNCVVFPQESSVKDVLTYFVQQTGVPSDDVFVCRGNRLSHPQDPLQHGATYQLVPRLCGGKGGFGSMLRALGAQIEKTTNREACRDLSGRRLRDVNHEKEMAAWLEKQEEREAEKEQRRRERLQRKLAQPKHVFSDAEYQRQCNELDERLEESVLKGLQVKRRNMEQKQQSAKKKLKTSSSPGFWSGVEHLLSSEDEDEAPSTSGCGAAVAMTTEEADPGLCGAEVPQSRSCSSTSAEHRKTPKDQKPEPDQTGEPGEEKSTEVSGVDLWSCTSQQRTRLLDLDSVTSVQQLEDFGLDVLKEALMCRGLKCGGTLAERAARLFSVRGLKEEQIDCKLFAKKK
ncbi:replication stress response regulator SDE2 isoform X2 [Thalassophryne amazonica]|uniref:replication stress response regulator SDE2 isoform X2 n=1 Tax=Thalassophryne amazonica TaxID=390379 RepID=UPI0014717F4E|nr:replication stress response regulator SDE2 isoform X2 [Thalassophryne amazonica]